MIFGLIIYIVGLIAGLYWILNVDGGWRIFWICAVILWFILGIFAIIGKKISDADKNKPTSEMNLKWLGWSIYAIGAIAIGYWWIWIEGGEGRFRALIFLVWTILGGILLVQLPKEIGLDKAQETSEIAKVISKASKTDGSGAYVGSTFYVGFEISNGTRKNFKLNIRQYNSVMEGETGKLTYKEYKDALSFVDFKPHK